MFSDCGLVTTGHQFGDLQSHTIQQTKLPDSVLIMSESTREFLSQIKPLAPRLSDDVKASAPNIDTVVLMTSYREQPLINTEPARRAMA
ncbi:hypothetical protein EVAR_30097_1 [Eumeta japonica]|uniref:Uncharacterized protein n=1 Tax=Eumeta variegata TaxID=151549 RepID=A0A4C1WHP6_EUMVA|nr:hypothetical protein EVAR_30097_1 [Eumeta japonica]